MVCWKWSTWWLEFPTGEQSTNPSQTWGVHTLLHHVSKGAGSLSSFLPYTFSIVLAAFSSRLLKQMQGSSSRALLELVPHFLFIYSYSIVFLSFCPFVYLSILSFLPSLYVHVHVLTFISFSFLYIFMFSYSISIYLKSGGPILKVSRWRSPYRLDSTTVVLRWEAMWKKTYWWQLHAATGDFFPHLLHAHHTACSSL